MGMQFVITEDYEEMSQAAARLMADVITARPEATLVVAVGNSPLGTFRELGRMRQRGDFLADQLRPFQLDEYLGLSIHDPRSLYGWVKRAFLDPLALPERQMVRLPGDASDPEEACRHYDRAVERAGGFDIALLGLGPNGHLGFNEPLSDALAPTRCVKLSAASLQSNAAYWGGHAQVPKWAMTCGMPHLLSARHIFLLVSGAQKREILAQTVNGPITPMVPSSYLQQAENVVIVADKAAWPEFPSHTTLPEHLLY